MKYNHLFGLTLTDSSASGSQQALLHTTYLLKKICALSAVPVVILFTLSFVNSWSIFLNISLVSIGLISFLMTLIFALRMKISKLDYASEYEVACLLLMATKYAEIKEAFDLLSTLNRPLLKLESKKMLAWVNCHAKA